MGSLSIMRLLANPEERLGSLFTNPGGPGVQGTGEFMRMRAPEIMEQSGGQYDIVRLVTAVERPLLPTDLF
jgi:hypothetical protein